MLTISKLKQEKLLAFKQGQKAKSKLISLLLSDLQAKEKDGETVGETEVINQIHSFTKQIKTNINLCESSGRLEDKLSYESELSSLNELLSLASVKMLSEEDIDGIIFQLGAQGMKDMGKVVGYLKSNHSGEFEPSDAAAYIKSKLSA